MQAIVCSDALGHMWLFLGHNEALRARAVCKNWHYADACRHRRDGLGQYNYAWGIQPFLPFYYVGRFIQTSCRPGGDVYAGLRVKRRRYGYPSVDLASAEDRRKLIDRGRENTLAVASRFASMASENVSKHHLLVASIVDPVLAGVAQHLNSFGDHQETGLEFNFRGIEALLGGVTACLEKLNEKIDAISVPRNNNATSGRPNSGGNEETADSGGSIASAGGSGSGGSSAGADIVERVVRLEGLVNVLTADVAALRFVDVSTATSRVG